MVTTRKSDPAQQSEHLDTEELDRLTHELRDDFVHERDMLLSLTDTVLNHGSDLENDRSDNYFYHWKVE